MTEEKMYYKLTNTTGRTYGGMKWGEGVSHRARGKGNNLCSKDVIHCYDHPLKAVLFNPIQANFENPRLWEGKAEDIVADDGLKCGCKKFTMIREIAMPIITTNQLVRFAILCAKEVYDDKMWNKWAIRWLLGKDRSEMAAEEAEEAAEAVWAARAAEASWAASWAARAASWAARAASWAARETSREAVEASVGASVGASVEEAGANIDFVKFIEKAIKEEK